MMTFMKMHHMDWLEEYLSTKSSDDSAYASLARLCQRFSSRYRFSQRVPCLTKMTHQDLSATREAFAISFWEKFRATAPRDIINVDETSIYYDMPPEALGSHHCGPISDKLPILFIVRGAPGGPIDTDELPTYPSGHMYVVQESAWMDKHVWAHYLNELLKFEIVGPSVILCDNLDCHVSEESVNTVSSELFSVLEPLPKNSTSACQPLDVGVMGPLKSKLRSKWLREPPVVTAAEKRLAMIKRTIQVWNEMPCDVISRSFDKALPKITIV
ncbi:hypothetical protein AeMF1_020601 [Aphanomyces euteiches]|nr:hypothetical protein AeMF1_020601 [Aphanomyces euteiches]